MKIIDNKKDYYDYLSGIYGEDTKIAYDRRGSIMIDPQRYMADSLECLFANKYFCDKPRTGKYAFSLPKWHQPNEKRSMQKILVGEYYYFLLETGYRHYLFEVERYLDEEKNNVMVPLLIKQEECEKYVKDAAVAIIYLGTYTYRLEDKPTEDQIKNAIRNPVLAKTYIPRFITADAIWQDVYNYLSSLRDVPITDTRSDVQKLESAGFDRIVSFRNVK